MDPWEAEEHISPGSSETALWFARLVLRSVRLLRSVLAKG